MSDGEQEMPEGAVGCLLKEPEPNQEAKSPQKSASEEESPKIQELVNTLSKVLKESMVVSSEMEYSRNVRALRICSVGLNFKTWVSQFLQYANLVHIKSSDF